MTLELSEILEYLNEVNISYNFEGKENIVIKGYSSFMSLASYKISWVKDQSNYNENALNGLTDCLLVVESDLEISKEYKEKLSFIRCEDPKAIFFSVLNKFYPQDKYIKPSLNSKVKGKSLGQNVYIGFNTFVGDNVEIGDNVIIKNNVSIEGNVKIGKNTLIHSGVIIGSDGFGYFKNEHGKNLKVPHYGGVVIGKDVEIGANSCIDRGTLDDTIIGNNVKIDNLCHIGHNCKIGNNTLVTALSMLGGSAELDKNNYVAPGALIKNQVYIGGNSLVGMGSVVIKDVEESKVVIGVPARAIRDNKPI